MFFKKRAFLALLSVILFVVLVYYNSRSKIDLPGSSFINEMAMGVYRPIYLVWDSITDKFSSIWNNYFNLVGMRRNYESLSEKLDFKELEILALKNLIRSKYNDDKNAEILRELNVVGLISEVLSYDAFSHSRVLLIASGKKDNVQVDQPVITYKGLVGRILRVYENTSQVLLLTDSHFAVDVRSFDSRVRALVVGTAKNPELQRYPQLSDLEFLRTGESYTNGDLLVTSGLLGIYPEGIPVGTIYNVEKDEGGNVISASVIPQVDITQIEKVIVLTGKH